MQIFWENRLLKLGMYPESHQTTWQSAQRQSHRGAQGAASIGLLANQTYPNEKGVGDGFWSKKKKFFWRRSWACVSGHSCTEEKDTTWDQLSVITLHFCLGTFGRGALNVCPKGWSNPKLILRHLKHRQYLIICAFTNLSICRADFEQDFDSHLPVSLWNRGKLLFEFCTEQ